MIGTMTPFRISFAGGGSDLPAFYEQDPGCVVSTSIDKHIYVFVHPSFDEKIQVKYSRTELVDRIDEIQHPIVREALRIFGLTGIDISSIADIPAGTGLGSSSSFTVGLFNALYGYVGEGASPEQLAADACRLEIDVLREPIGRQDQYAAAHGGLNLIDFHADHSVTVEPIQMPQESLEALENNLLMFYSGGRRAAGEILMDQANNMNRQKRASLIRMTELARELGDSLAKGAIEHMGHILDEGWNLKKSLSDKISRVHIDDLYETAMNSGATGGKLLGAGNSGFLLFYCPLEQQARLRNALSGLRETKFRFDRQGTRRILGDSS